MMTAAAIKKILVLDAMGVIYAEANDGLNLLYPFILEKGCCRDVAEIIGFYNAASVGKISSEEFWRLTGVDPALEDEYLQRHLLSEGLPDFLAAVTACGMELWCLSNDVSEWSVKLRKRFGLERFFRGFIISGDVGARKPDPAIFLSFLQQSGYAAGDVIFVDDRLRNIRAADSLGIQGILFNPSPLESRSHAYPIVRNFSELLKKIETA